MNNIDLGQGYRVVRVIGSGAMGVVYEAWDTRLNRRIALKLLHPHMTADSASLARLEQEARLAACVEHPNVVRVYRIEPINDQLAIEMQLIDGSPLQSLTAAGKVTVNQALNLFEQILEALTACHAQNVIHCDLKPANLLVTPAGHVYLTDFGISQGGCEKVTLPYGEEGQWGTPRYCPPEAWSGAPTTIKWDLYSAGAIFYELLSGKTLFDGKSKDDLIRCKIDEDLPSLLELRSDISPALAKLVSKLVAREAALRPESARAALALLYATPEYKEGDEATQPIEVPLNVPPQGLPKGPKFSSYTMPLIAGTLLLASFLALWALRREDPAVQPENAPPAAPIAKAKNRIGESIVLREDLFFAFDDGIHGMELWCYRTAMDKFMLVADLNPGALGSNPRRFMFRNNDDFLFAAETPELGEELYACHDHADFRLVKDIIAGPMGSEPEPLAVHETLVLFYATSLNNGRELWCTNTREAQTGMVADLHGGRGGSVPMNPRLYPGGRYVYLIAYGGEKPICSLWRFDFESLAINMLAPVAEHSAAIGKTGGNLLLENFDSEHGNELWINDPARVGIRLLADLYPGTESSNPSQFFPWKEVSFFQARNNEFGNELWRTDGTVEGTMLLDDINPGSGNSDPYGFKATEGLVFFRAKDDAHGNELWMTDGNSGGARIVADIWPGPESSSPYNIVAMGGHLFFTADDGVHGEELWFLNVAQPETTARMLKDVLPGTMGSEAHNLVFVAEDKGFFTAYNPSKTAQLYSLRKPGNSGDFVIEAMKMPDQPESGKL